MPSHVWPLFGPEDGVASIAFGVRPGSSVNVPDGPVPDRESPGKVNESPSMTSVVRPSSSSGTSLPSRTAETKLQVPWSLARSPFGASAAKDMPAMIATRACALMPILPGRAGELMRTSIVPGDAGPRQGEASRSEAVAGDTGPGAGRGDWSD